MSNHYIGLDLFDLENNGLRQPISRITLYRGDNAALTAGDDTGLEVVADCIYVTQEMVEALLSAARGYQYHAYSAQAARLNPAAELGDTVEVGSIVSVLAQISDNGDLYPDIAAPGDREVEDEYPAAGPLTQALTKAFDKKLATARSEITKTTDKIAFAIFGEDGKGGLNGRVNTFTMGLSSISTEIKGYKDTVTGYEEQLALYKQDLDGYSGEVSKYTKEVNGYKEQTISYKGSVDGFEQRVALYQEQAGKTQEAYSLISQKVNNIKLEVTNNDDTASIQLVVNGENQGAPAEIKMNGLVTFTALEDGPEGETTIHGGWLKGVILEGNTIKGGTYKNLNGDTWFGLGQSEGKWGFLLTNTMHKDTGGIFSVYNGDFGFMTMYGKANYGFLLTDGSNEAAYPQGTWDFSQANLITKGEVGFVPVFQ